MKKYLFQIQIFAVESILKFFFTKKYQLRQGQASLLGATPWPGFASWSYAMARLCFLELRHGRPPARRHRVLFKKICYLGNNCI
jgi:hypothetical protein